MSKRRVGTLLGRFPPDDDSTNGGKIKLNEEQQRILSILQRCTNGMTAAEVREGGVLYRLIGTCGVIHSDYSDSEVIGSFRTIAGSLLDAANQIEETPEPEVYPCSTGEVVVQVEGFSEIDFRVMNCDNDIEGIQRVRQMLATFKR